MQNFKYILTHTSGNLTLVYSPLNWNNFNILFKRSERYHSVLRKQIYDLEFPLDGKAYIDTIYETYGIDTAIACEIQYLNKLTKDYATLFDGIIDLSSWVSLRDTTSVKIIDSTTMVLFSSRDEIEVPINRETDIDGDAVASYTFLNSFTIEGVNLEELANYENTANSNAITTPENTNFSGNYGVTADEWDINEIGADAIIPAVTLGSGTGPIYTNNGAATVEVRYRIKTRAVGKVTVADVGSQDWTWNIETYLYYGGSVKVIDISDSGNGSKETEFDTSYDSGILTSNVVPGGILHFYHRWYGTVKAGDTITPAFDFEPIHIEIYEVIPAKIETHPDIPLLHEVGAKLLEIITGQSDPLNAPLIGRTDSEPRTYVGDGDYSLNGLASGYMLRGFPHSDKPLTVSFEDYFKSIDALFNLGMMYDEQNSEFVIAAKEDFYKVSKIITLGEVQELEISIASNHYFNKIQAGYSKSLRYEEVNGGQNFNVQTVFINDGKRISNTLDISSVFRADDYGIELSRQSEYDDSAAEDTKLDSETFFINVKRDNGDYMTNQGYDDFDEIENVYSPETRLNLNISPKRNLQRHLNQLSVPLFLSNGDTNFMQSQFNLALETKKAAEDTVEETGDIAYADLEEPLYYPEIYNFTAELTIDIILQLISDPHGYVEFDYLETTYSGYIIEVSSEPFNNRGNWTLVKRNPNRT